MDRRVQDAVEAAGDVTLVESLATVAAAVDDERLGAWLRTLQSADWVCLRCGARGSTVFLRWVDGDLYEVERRGDRYTSPPRVVDTARAQALIASSPAVGLVPVERTPFDETASDADAD